MHRAALLALVTLLLGSLAAPQPLAAQQALLEPLPSGSRVALLPVTQHALALPLALREEAVHSITAALRKRGYDLLPSAQVNATLAERLPDGCRDAVTCDPELALAALGVDAVISIALWQRTQGTQQVLVHVRRQQGYGQAELDVAAAGLSRTAAQALEQALEDSRARHDVQVRIESEPSGARVIVDQAQRGVTPATLELAPGEHLLSVETPGYVTATRYIEVPAEPSTHIIHRIVMTRAQAPSGEAPAPDLAAANSGDPGRRQRIARRNATANYVLAAVLGVIAVPLLANAVYTGAQSGQCDGNVDAQGHCDQRVILGPSFWTSLALGSIAAAGGAVVLVVQPFGGAGERDPHAVRLQWRSQF